jgi:hypothetical protein
MLCLRRKNADSRRYIFARIGKMDRIDAIKAFLTAIDEGSLSGAARRLNRSPAAITRTIDFL